MLYFGSSALGNDDRPGEVSLSLLVTGRVQGVGFRWWARGVARREGLIGRVWNRADGSVRVDVRGPASDVAAFRARLGGGPPASTVEAVIVMDRVPTVPGEDFHIGPPPGGGEAWS